MTQLPLRGKTSHNKMLPSIALSGQRSIVLLLALLATAAVTLVRIDANWTPWTIVAPVIVSSLLAISLMLLELRNIGANAKSSTFSKTLKPSPSASPTSETRSRTRNQRYIFLTVILILFPFVANSLVKIFFGLAGEPFELLMLATVQQGAIAAVTLHNTRKAEWISGLLSFFLFVFCVTISGDIAVYILAGIFALLGIWWLMGAYWERIQSGFVAQQSVPIVRLRFGILSAVIGVLLILGYLGSHPSLATYALNGFMPTSGGNGEADDSARSGIGDGEQMVAAQETAMSFGPVESELFLEDTAPSLYDMFSEFYGQDAKIKKNIERAISLNQTEMQQQHQHLSQSQKSSREFSAVRKSTPRLKQQPKGTQSPALIYLIGATPAHLSLETFDAFDGKDWTHQQPSSTVKPQLIYQKDKPWALFSLPESVPYRITQHQFGIKIINLKSSRIPSPDLVNAVHIDKVDRPDFYGLTNDGIPQMVGRDYTPQLTVLRLQNTFPHLHQLRKTSFFKKYASAVRDTAIATDPASVQERQKVFEVVAAPPMDAPLPHPPSPALEPMPTTSQSPTAEAGLQPLDPFLLQPLEPTDSLYEVAIDLDEIASLAKLWTTDTPRGWEQVEMIVDTLRSDFEHDSAATAPEDCTNVVRHFLKARKGPDYLFATTAA
ncbi:MAG: Protein-glutamine gamma-glutamyltransferase, partial [Planctomycetota bacterium]